MELRLKITIAAFILLAIWAVIAPWLATRLIVERPIVNADAIIVLSGSSVYKERTQKAAELYKRGVAPIIFITNDGEHSGWSQAEQANITYVELEKRELIAGGVSPDAIVEMPQLVAGTDEEANAFKTEIESRGLTSVVIVTSAYHSRRSLWTFDQILAPTKVEIGIEHAAVGLQTPEPTFWWLRPRGWQMVAGEYVKSAVYWTYY